VLLCRAQVGFLADSNIPLTTEQKDALYSYLPDAMQDMIWAPCFSSFTDDASDPSTFHAQCDEHDVTLVLARHGAVPETSNGASSPAWVEDADWIFGGYVSNFYASAVLMSQVFAFFFFFLFFFFFFVLLLLLLLLLLPFPATFCYFLLFSYFFSCFL
jgi:hypothetical protein